MKKRFALMVSLVLLLCAVWITPALAADADSTQPPMPTHLKDGIGVAAVFADGLDQPIVDISDGSGRELDKVDTVWIFYTDNTFDQYAEILGSYTPYSTGTYSFKDDGSFSAGKGKLVIERDKHYSIKEGALVDHSSTLECDLGTLGYAKLFGPEDGKEVEAIFGDDNQLLYKDETQVISFLDSVWIFFTDGSFKVYAFMDQEVVLFGSDTYEFDENGDFHKAAPGKKDIGKITLNMDYSISENEQPVRTFALDSVGYEAFYEKLDESLVLPPRDGN